MQKEKKRGIIGYLMLSLRGIVMGAADVVPGVSGGTMAFILGIYEELLDAIRKCSSAEAIKMVARLKFKQAFEELPWRFLLFLGLGIAGAFLTLAGPIKWMLENQAEIIWAFFFGLVLASVTAVCPRVKKWNWRTFSLTLAGALFAFWLVGIVPAETPDTWWFVMFCGALAICAMILPGISGSFILLLLGKYSFMLSVIRDFKSALTSFDIAVLLSNGIIIACFMIGMVIGLASFVRLLGWLFRKYHDFTVAVLIGFMSGSLRRVWPWKTERLCRITECGEEVLTEVNALPPDLSAPVLWAVAAGIAGFVSVLTIEYFANQLKEEEYE